MGQQNQNEKYYSPGDATVVMGQRNQNEKYYSPGDATVVMGQPNENEKTYMISDEPKIVAGKITTIKKWKRILKIINI